VGTPEGHQKSNLICTSKMKKNMESFQQSLQTQPKNINKLSKQQINQSERKFFQKKYV
jgi:hypothetical protein